MSIYRHRPSGQWMFEFDRRIAGRRVRRRQLLPAGWSRARADAYDRTQSAALYALATNVEQPRWLIEHAVAAFGRERAVELKHGANVRRELAALHDWYAGRAVDELPAVCREYATDQAGALAPATVRNRIAYLRSACRWAWKRHGMGGEADPGARVQVPTVRNAREVVVSRADVVRLCRACRNRGARAVIRLAYYSGMRIGEILAAERIAGHFLLRDTKNGDARLVPIHPRIATAARVPLPTRGELHYWWFKTRAACELEHVHLHDLRHSAASAMVNAGVSLADVGAVLGHRSAASTKRYSHWATERIAAALGTIGRKAAA